MAAPAIIATSDFDVILSHVPILRFITKRNYSKCSHISSAHPSASSTFTFLYYTSINYRFQTHTTNRTAIKMSPPSSVPKEYRPGYLPPSITHQAQKDLPGKQRPLDPTPFNDVMADGSKYKPAGKLEGKNAVVTGGDSGIGRAVTIL